MRRRRLPRLVPLIESFRSLIVEQSVTVSSWRTLTLSSNFVIPLFLFLRLDSRDMTLEE